MVRELFVMARQHAPSIIFMDEIDSIGSARIGGGKNSDSEVQRTMLELLNQLDGFEATQSIKVCFIILSVDHFLLILLISLLFDSPLSASPAIPFFIPSHSSL